MRWVLRIGVGLGALLVAALIAAFTLRPFAFPAELSEPGEAGRRVDENGLLANYYPSPSGEPSPGILALGGSEGGLGSGMKAEALSLQAQGYSVLHVAYYNAPAKPKDLVEIPLEDFYAGLEWLKARPEVDPDRLAVFGVSKGAEASLLLASRRDDIDAAVLGVPSSVVWAGIDWTMAGMFGLKPPRSSWSDGGEPVAFLPYGAWDAEQGISSLYSFGLEKLSDHPEAIIPVEKVAGPVLLVCGGKDNLWPSCPMSDDIAARASQRNGPDVTVLSYPDAGHAAIGVPVDGGADDGEWFGGGTRATDNVARADSWPQVLQFFDSVFAPTSAEEQGE